MLKSCVILIALLVSVIRVNAEVLATRTFDTGTGILTASTDNYVDLSISIDTSSGGLLFPLYIYNFPSLTESTSPGSTFTVTPSDSPQLFAALTDGDPTEYISINDSFGGLGGGGSTGPKSSFFFNYPLGLPNGIDFQGYSITDITLTVDSLVFSSDPQPSDQATSSLGVTLTVDGSAVPEPSTWLLLLVGGLSLVLFRYNRLTVRINRS